MGEIKPITRAFLDAVEELTTYGLTEKKIITKLGIKRSKLSNMKRGNSQSDEQLNDAIQDLLNSIDKTLKADEPIGEYRYTPKKDQSNTTDWERKYQELLEEYIALQKSYQTLSEALVKKLGTNEKPNDNRNGGRYPR